MKEYFIDDKHLFQAKSTTKGSQVKYYKDGYFYKINKTGNEGFVEFVVSKMLSCSTIPSRLVLPYEYCSINGRKGCRSKNFLQSYESFYTINSLFVNLTGKINLSDILSGLGNASERLEYILDIAAGFGFPRSGYREYLKILMQIDLLIENCDRHIHNYGLVFGNGKFRLPPVFDNGFALRTNGGYNPVPCTLSGSFIEQATVFGFPVEAAFLIDYKKFFEELGQIRRDYGDLKEVKVLEKNLLEYKDIFDAGNLPSC